MRVLLLVEMDFGLSFKNFKSLLVTSCRLMFLLYSQIYVYTYAYAYMPIIFLYFSQKRIANFLVPKQVPNKQSWKVMYLEFCTSVIYLNHF